MPPSSPLAVAIDAATGAGSAFDEHYVKRFGELADIYADAAAAKVSVDEQPSVIAPHAHVKIFVTASPEVRAERRFREARGRGEDAPYETILDDIRKRDARDAERVTAPLKAAEDAVLLDTSAMTIDEVLTAALAIVRRRSPDASRASA